MPAISKIRFTNVIYENGGKRYNDDIFQFDGHNGAILLENGGGKTVFIQTALQAVLPHTEMAERKIKSTLMLEGAPAHVAIEWIVSDQPRRYALTAVSLYMENNKLQSVKYAYDYMANESNGIEELPFSLEGASGQLRPATRREISDYYLRMQKHHDNARVFSTIHEYNSHLEDHFKIIASEWRKMAVINSSEGNVDEFFSSCRTTEQLMNNLLIPVVEDAIAGEEGVQFVETFERQREHFKKNKLLHEKINESIQVKEALDRYVSIWRAYDKTKNACEEVKVQAKSLASYIDNRVDQVKQEMDWHDKDREVLKKDERRYLQMLESYEILKLEKDLELAAGGLGKALEQEKRVRDALSMYGMRKQNLEIHMLDRDIRRLEEKRQRLLKQMNQLGQSPEAEDIASLINENGSLIKGHFEYELELVGRELKKLREAETLEQFRKEKTATKLEKASETERTLLAEMTRAATVIDMLEDDMDEIKTALFEEDGIMTVEQAISRKSIEAAGLKQSALELKDVLSHLDDRMEDAIDERKALDSEMEELSYKLKESRVYVEACREAWDEIGIEMNEASIRKASLNADLDDRISLLENKRERLIEQSSCYISNEKDILGQLLGDVGFSYEVDRMAVLITGDENTGKLASKIKALEEKPPWSAAVIAKGLSNAATFIYQESGNRTASLEKLLDERKELESVLYTLKRKKDILDSIDKRYPLERLEEHLAVVSGAEEQLDSKRQRVAALLKEIEASTASRKATEEKLVGIKEALDALDQLISLGESFLEKQKAHSLASENHMSISRNHAEAKRERTAYEKELADTDDKLSGTKNERHAYEVERKVLLSSELYKEVIDHEAIGTRRSLESLVEERGRLKDEEKGINRNHLDAEEQIRDIVETLKSLQRELDRKKAEAKHPIEPIGVYYENELEDLYSKIKRLDSELAEILRENGSLDSEKLKLETKIQLLTEDVSRKYGSVYHFETAMERIPQQLQIEKGTIRDRNRRMDEEQSEIEDDLHSLEEKRTLLKIKNGASGFMNDEVKTKALSSAQADAFEQNADKMVGHLFSALEESTRAAKKGYAEVLKGRETLADGLNAISSDARLRESVIRNVRNKESLDELLSYQDQFGEVIDKTIQVAEDDKRESDTELQTFLRHITSYVRNVTEELTAIEKKTAVTLGAETQQIYQIRLPEWEAEEGRILLRNYINRLIEETEQSEDAHGMSEEMTRIHLKDQLDIRNLLKVVFGNQSIKVSCRKVSNGLRISANASTWESSNKWSGGEKWSKNMTLFLGLMNYMAEKKQHLDEHHRGNRSVILDNPFGKASSEHVLEPVFAVAKTLGFQVIALTAHAEGQFISRYFPVVYSCRLRQSKDPSKRLMEHERTVNYAYLREYAPKTMMRMEEVEQIGLFQD